MGDDDQRTLPAQQGLFQPLDRFQVQVIGRLVQQQQVRLAQDQLGQQRPGALAAAQVRQRLVVLVLVEAQPTQHLGDADLVVVAAGHFEGHLGLAVGCQQVVIVGVRHSPRRPPAGAPAR